MDTIVKAEYEAQAKELRASLKKWESDWAGGHNGAKPGRQDIKQNPHIGKLCAVTMASILLTVLCSANVQGLQQDPGHSCWQGIRRVQIRSKVEITEAKIAVNTG